MVDGPEEAPVGGRQVGRQGQGRHAGQVFVGAGRVGELHRDRLHGALGDFVVELLDGLLRLAPLVEADEAYAFGQAWQHSSGMDGKG